MEAKIQVTRSSLPSKDEYFDEVSSLWETCWITNMGAKHQELERLLRERLRVWGVSLFANGHSALEGVLEALRLGEDGRRKVITTPFTFASTTHAIVRRGLEPVFADIDPDDFTIDPNIVEKLIDKDTCAILPVHVYGNMCDVDAIQKIAQKYGLSVVYDAAHAFAVEKKNPVTGDWESAASFGDASIFSFHATKVFNTIEGGAVCYRDESLCAALNLCKNFGITGPESVEYVGGNAKMNEFCAAMGICNLRHIDEQIEKRGVVAKRYRTLLDKIKGVKQCPLRHDIKGNNTYMPVVFRDDFGASRDEVFDALAAKGILARKYFYPLVSDYECYKNRFDSRKTPIARDAAARILTLPLYADLPLKDVDNICEVIAGCHDGKVGAFGRGR